MAQVMNVTGATRDPIEKSSLSSSTMILMLWSSGLQDDIQFMAVKSWMVTCRVGNGQAI